MHVSDAERGDAANEQGGDYAADGDCETLAVDGGEHLAGDDAADDAPAYLQDDVEDAGQLGRPVAHEVSTQDLLDTASGSASIVEIGLLRYPYHGPVPTGRPKGGNIRYTACGQTGGEDGDADGVCPAQGEQQSA